MSAAIIPLAIWQDDRKLEQLQCRLFPGVTVSDLQSEIARIRSGRLELGALVRRNVLARPVPNA